MGTTSNYALPWPAPSALLKNGASAIRLLAEAVDTALQGPLLATTGDGTLSWDSKVAEVPWDVTDSPDRKRGTWTSPGSTERLVIPGKPGWYFVAASVRFQGKAEPDVYQVSIMTRAQGSDVGSGTRWATQRIELPDNSDSYTDLNVATMVRVANSDPAQGIAVRLSYAGSTQPPATDSDANKLRIHWLSAL
jgi:hypothetical protein